MQSPLKAIAIDLDGTLLNSKGDISVATHAAIQRVLDMGLRLVLASGRMTTRITPFAERFKGQVSVISFNGAQILEPNKFESMKSEPVDVKASNKKKWKTVYHRNMQIHSIQAVYELCERENLFLNVYRNDKLYAYHPQSDFAFSDFYSGYTLAEYTLKTNQLKALPIDNIVKLLVIETPARRNFYYDQIFATFKSHCAVLKSNPEYLEFIEKDLSKGTALEFWLASHGLQASELLAFGDAENDLDMLRLAGIGIAMANATAQVLAEYPRISKWHHDEDAIAKELALIFSPHNPFPDPSLMGLTDQNNIQVTVTKDQIPRP